VFREVLVMVTEASALERVLDLQSEDAAINRLGHRRETLEEAARLQELTATLEELDADLSIATKQRDEIARDQDRLEGAIAAGDAKIQREEHRLFSGAVSNPKELGALQAEVAMLKRQRAELEDKLLEVMVQRDGAMATLESLSEERARIGAEAAELGRKVEELTSAIDRELSEHKSRRDSIASDIPADLTSLYESIRDTKGGIGAAALEGDTCTGCHTKLPAREVERLRAEGGLQRCDNCRRILVVR
jgi:uncharacterized protein